MNVTQAVRQRISTRAFLDTPISQEDLGDLLATAQRSPSGGNLQPWRTIAVAGAARDAVIEIAKRDSADNLRRLKKWQELVQQQPDLDPNAVR